MAFTTGILIGIGETFEERVDALFAIRALHEKYGHIQEVIVQNFRAKANIPMAHQAEPTYTWSVEAARHRNHPNRPQPRLHQLRPCPRRKHSAPQSECMSALRDLAN